jgi:hypothetical protein
VPYTRIRAPVPFCIVMPVLHGLFQQLY